MSPLNSDSFQSNIQNIRKKLLSRLCKGSIVLSVIAFLINLYTIGYYAKLGQDFKGGSLLHIVLITLIFVCVYLINEKVSQKIAASVFITIYFLVSFYTASQWGADTPQALLMLAINIVMTSILFGQNGVFIITVTTITFLIVLTYLQTNKILLIDDSWKLNSINIRDSIITSISLSIITLVSWLSNREMERSLRKAEESELALKKERDMLEIRVDERTKELKQAQMEKMLDLYKFADFGKMASGLIHDLSNPLTAAMMNVEFASKEGRKKTVQNKNNLKMVLDRAQDGLKQMEAYVISARRQVQKQDAEQIFDVSKAIQVLMKMFSHREKAEHVRIILNAPEKLSLHGNPIAFHQALSNVLSNAFDSYSAYSINPKEIVITVARKKVGGKKFIRIEIHDNGEGITQKNMEKIFQPFFTTKSTDRGTGIGLSITKKIFEESFDADIEVSSKEGFGTTFAILIPLKTKK